MTSKVYKTAQGKTVDLGTIMLKNENVRAVGNMNVNARGDKLDSNNRIVETKPQQIQRQINRTTNVSDEPVHTSSNKARQARQNTQVNTVDDAPQVDDAVLEETLAIVTAPPVQEVITASKIPEGGLAAAIARTKEVKQELEKTQRQKAQAQGVRKL